MDSDILGDKRLTTLGLLLEAVDALERRAAEIYRDHGVSAREFSVLIRVSRSEHLSMKDLALQTGTSTSGITSVVDRLERAGLAERAVSPTDRRSWMVSLTTKGKRQTNEIGEDLLPMIQGAIYEPLADSMEDFEISLRRLRDALHPDAAAGAGVG